MRFRNFLPTLAAAIFLGATGSVLAAGAFVAGFDDLPLMPGLTEVPGAGTMFESDHGRVGEAYAVGRVNRKEIANFYAQALPQLGWKKADERSFMREGEKLTLEAFEESGYVTLRFTLAPE